MLSERHPTKWTIKTGDGNGGWKDGNDQLERRSIDYCKETLPTCSISSSSATPEVKDLLNKNNNNNNNYNNNKKRNLCCQSYEGLERRAAFGFRFLYKRKPCLISWYDDDHLNKIESLIFLVFSIMWTEFCKVRAKNTLDKTCTKTRSDNWKHKPPSPPQLSLLATGETHDWLADEGTIRCRWLFNYAFIFAFSKKISPKASLWLS